MKTLDKSLSDAIAFIKTCPYKGTAIKVELEAELNRPYDDNGYRSCNDCDGDGTNICNNCDDGYLYNDETEQYDIMCDDCGGDYEIRCEQCDGSGEIYYDSDESFSSEEYCEEYILNSVSQEARDALIYASFYNDGSVDSEFTFTVKIDRPQAIIEFINAFKSLAKAIGNGIDTSGAGMHIAILNSKNGNYPEGNNLQTKHANNFKYVMDKLMPALFFLASPDYRSRGLQYRNPEVSTRNKYTAINGSMGCYEFRVFETCYDHPERIYDMLCVIAKTLQFYTYRRAELPFFGKIGELVMPDGEGLHRFYYTEKHIDALRAGLKILTPDHKSIPMCYKERNFKITKKELKKKYSIARQQYRKDFEQAKIDEHRYFERQLSDSMAWYDRNYEYYRTAPIDRMYSISRSSTPLQFFIQETGTREEFREKTIKELQSKITTTSLKKYITNRMRPSSSYKLVTV